MIKTQKRATGYVIVRTALGLTFSFILAILITSLWWRGNLKTIIDKWLILKFSSMAYRGWIYNPLTLQSLFFYFIHAMYSISPFLFILFIAFFPKFYRDNIKYKPVILLWIISSYLILTFFSEKWGRYYFPALPAFAIITAISLMNIKKIKFRIFLIVFTVILSLLQFYDLSYGIHLFPNLKINYYNSTLFGASSPRRRQEPMVVDKFLNAIYKDKKGGQLYRLKIILVGIPETIDSGILEYIFELKDKRILLSKFFESISNYENCDYIIVVAEKSESEKAVSDKLDLSKIKNFNYKNFLISNYPGAYYDFNEFQKAYLFYETFKVIDSFVTEEFIFRLCKKPTR